MDVYIYLIPITIILAMFGLCVLIWSINSNQCDDLEHKGSKIILIDEKSL